MSGRATAEEQCQRGADKLYKACPSPPCDRVYALGYLSVVVNGVAVRLSTSVALALRHYFIVAALPQVGSGAPCHVVYTDHHTMSYESTRDLQ